MWFWAALLIVQKDILKFIDKYELPFDLISDEKREVLNSYGVWGPKKFMGREYDGIHRTTFVINEKGVLEDVITKVKTKEHTNADITLKK